MVGMMCSVPAYAAAAAESPSAHIVISPSKIPRMPSLQALMYVPFEVSRIPGPQPGYTSVPQALWNEMESFDQHAG